MQRFLHPQRRPMASQYATFDQLSDFDRLWAPVSAAAPARESQLNPAQPNWAIQPDRDFQALWAPVFPGMPDLLGYIRRPGMANPLAPGVPSAISRPGRTGIPPASRLAASPPSPRGGVNARTATQQAIPTVNRPAEQARRNSPIAPTRNASVQRRGLTDENRDGRINNHDLDARVQREAMAEYRVIRDRLRNARSREELDRELHRYQEFLNTPEMRRQRAQQWRLHNEWMARLTGGLFGMASAINAPLGAAMRNTGLGLGVAEFANWVTSGGGTNPDHRIGD